MRRAVCQRQLSGLYIMITSSFTIIFIYCLVAVIKLCMTTDINENDDDGDDRDDNEAKC